MPVATAKRPAHHGTAADGNEAPRLLSPARVAAVPYRTPVIVPRGSASAGPRTHLTGTSRSTRYGNVGHKSVGDSGHSLDKASGRRTRRGAAPPSAAVSRTTAEVAQPAKYGYPFSGLSYPLRRAVLDGTRDKRAITLFVSYASRGAPAMLRRAPRPVGRCGVRRNEHR